METGCATACGIHSLDQIWKAQAEGWTMTTLASLARFYPGAIDQAIKSSSKGINEAYFLECLLFKILGEHRGNLNVRILGHRQPGIRVNLEATKELQVRTNANAEIDAFESMFTQSAADLLRKSLKRSNLQPVASPTKAPAQNAAEKPFCKICQTSHNGLCNLRCMKCKIPNRRAGHKGECS